MSEQAVQVLQIVPGEDLDTAVGEQAHGLVSFVDENGDQVDVGGGGTAPDPVPEERLLPEGGTTGQVVKKTAEGVEWAADANTAPPAAGTAAELQAGTVTQTRVWSPKVIADEIDRRVAAAIAAIPPAGG